MEDLKVEEKVRVAFKITIDGKPFEWHHRLITGSQLRELAHVPPDYSIFLKVRHGEDELINEDEKVDLSHPGKEHFYSCKTAATNG